MQQMVICTAGTRAELCIQFGVCFSWPRSGDRAFKLPVVHQSVLNEEIGFIGLYTVHSEKIWKAVGYLECLQGAADLEEA